MVWLFSYTYYSSSASENFCWDPDDVVIKFNFSEQTKVKDAQYTRDVVQWMVKSKHAKIAICISI